MRVVVVLLAFFATVISGQTLSPFRSCPFPGGRDDVLDCITTLVDTNPADGNITETELDDFIEANTGTGCLPTLGAQTLNGTDIMTLCDVGVTDGVLSIEDWEDPDGCAQSVMRQHYLCLLCTKCGYSVPTKREVHQ